MSILSGTVEPAFAPSVQRSRPIWLLALAVAGSGLHPARLPDCARPQTADADDVVEGVEPAAHCGLLTNTASLTAAVTAAPAAAIALPIAYPHRTHQPPVGAASGGRSPSFRWRSPSYVGAFAFIIALGPNGSLQDLAGEPLGCPAAFRRSTGSSASWLTLTLFTFPYLLIVIRAGLRDLDPGIEEAARSLGQSAWGAFWRVTVPQLRMPLATGSLLVALYVISDFGAVSMMRFETFTRAMYVRIGTSFDRSSIAVLCSDTGRAGRRSSCLIDWSQRRNARYHRLGSGAARMPRLVRLRRYRWPALIGLSVVWWRRAIRASRRAVSLVVGRAAGRGDLPRHLERSAQVRLCLGAGREPRPSRSRSRLPSWWFAVQDSCRASSTGLRTSATPCRASSSRSR